MIRHLIWNGVPSLGYLMTDALNGLYVKYAEFRKINPNQLRLRELASQ